MGIGKHIVITFTNEWRQFFTKGWNWRSFNLIQVYFEQDVMTAGYECILSLAGFSIRLRINTNKSLELFAEWTKESEKELKKEDNNGRKNAN